MFTWGTAYLANVFNGQSAEYQKFNAAFKWEQGQNLSKIPLKWV
jgi:hypothetical protein